MRDRFAGENCREHLFQIMAGGVGSLLPEGDKTIIDSSVINQVFARRKNRCFRCDARPAQLHKGLRRIAQNAARILILFGMLTNFLDRNIRIRVNEPEIDPTIMEFLIKPPNLRRITIGDGAISFHKNEDRGFRAVCLEWIDLFAGQIQPGSRESGGAEDMTEDEKTNDPYPMS